MTESTSAVPQTSTASVRDYLGVSLFWLALSFLWGALLTIALPSHIQTLFGNGGKDAALTVLTASGACVAGLTQIVAGALSDGSRSKWGRRRPFLFWGTLLAVIPLMLLPRAHTLATLVFAFALLQLFINIAAGPYNALMHDVIPASGHDTASVWIGVSGIVGRIGGAIVAALLLGAGIDSSQTAALNNARSQSNFGVLLALFATVVVVIMLVTLWLIRERPLKVEGKAASLMQRVSSTFRVPLRPYPDFTWLVVSRFGITMGIYTVSFCLLYYIRDTLGFHDEKQSLGLVQNVLVIATVAGLLGTFPSGAFSKRVGRKRVLYGANIICMAAGLCFALASNITIAYIAAAIFGVGFGAFAAVDWALATGLLPPDEPAKYMGVWGLSDTLSQVVAPLVAGPIALSLNRALGAGIGYRALMMLALGWFLLGTLALKPIRETRSEEKKV